MMNLVNNFYDFNPVQNQVYPRLTRGGGSF